MDVADITDIGLDVGLSDSGALGGIEHAYGQAFLYVRFADQY